MAEVTIAMSPAASWGLMGLLIGTVVQSVVIARHRAIRRAHRARCPIANRYARPPR